MVRGSGSVQTNISLKKYSIENKYKSRLSIAMILLMIFSLAAPSISPISQVLEDRNETFHTSNGTLDDVSTSTLLSNLNTSNPIEVIGVMDDSHQVHLVWIENGTNPQLYYALISTSGIDTVLIASTAVGQNSTTALSSPSLVIDSNYRTHIVWAITDTEILYTLLDSSLDDQDGSPGDIASMTLVSTYTIAIEASGVRNEPDIAIDSFDGIHVVWVDTYDSQSTFFGASLIYYAMFAFNSSGTNSLSTLINNTIITPAIGYKGSPAISIGTNNTVIVVWEDTRGSLIEYVGLIDSSGSMTTEWLDMCAVFYGGNLSSGEYFQGVKPMLESASITVLETLYAISGQMSYANSQKNCEDAYEVGGYGDGPRDTHLGQNMTDTSGGIRALSDVMYNGSSYNIPSDWSYNSEMWGPGSTWACLSWRDNSGSVPGNPATPNDHQWNPNATRLIIPVSDEGPFGGDPAQDSDDNQSIIEAHDACTKAGIIPIAVAGTSAYGASTAAGGQDSEVRSHMMDLVQCPSTNIGTQQRTCDDLSWSTKDAGGEMYLYPSNNMANFEGNFESGSLTNGWAVSSTSNDLWSVESANNGIIYSNMNLCSIGGSVSNPSFNSLNCTYSHPSNISSVDITVGIDNWPSEFSMDVLLPNGTVDSFNSTDLSSQGISSGNDGILVSYTDVGNYTIYLNDSFGDGGSSVSADYSYVSQTNPSYTPISGTYSAQSGTISDGESTSLEFVGILADGLVSFSYNISSESNYDFLQFYIDGVQLAQWSGSQNGNFTTLITLGQHTLMWKYVKDGSVSVGLDAAWIDDVVIPVANYTEELNALVNEIVSLTTGSGSTETFLTVLNPYSILNSPRSDWSRGMPAISIDDQTGEYIEDIGPNLDYIWQDGIGWSTIGHFVLVNDTRLTSGHGWSVNPEVNVDNDGNVHVVWVDGRDSMPGKDVPSQLHYMQLDLSRAGVLDGEAAGLDLNQVAVVTNSAVPGSDMTYGANPRVDFDNDGSVHITWFESMEDTITDEGRVELRWTRINAPQLNNDGELLIGKTLTDAYGVINTRIIASSSDNLMGIFGNNVESASQPIVNFNWPNRDIIWTTDDCTNSDSGQDKWDVCMWSENVWDIEISSSPNEITFLPSQSLNTNYQINAIQLPGESDIIVIDVEGVPNSWFIDVGFAGNYQHTTTLIENQMSSFDLFIRAPTLSQANGDQEFWLTLSVTSSTKDEAVITKLIKINLINDQDWNDDDGDGILDLDDLCQFGETDWISTDFNDHDSDGCRDSSEDLDDDNDDYLDSDDLCPNGQIGTILDNDMDGCDDITEDIDNDGDGVINGYDLCPNGAQYWGPYALDNDGDGCRDADEDNNDDNDPYLDSDDDCNSGHSWWDDLYFDHDNDGCHDVFEDEDDDNDGINDREDSCPQGLVLWISSPATDQDRDGCHDSTEDDDRDNDGILDQFDQCSMGVSDWSSSTINDWDLDGCNDFLEDLDDDNDGFLDTEDNCVRSKMYATTGNSDGDLDNDGCLDDSEDRDNDNDGIDNEFDNCQDNPYSDWVSVISEDMDRDGCHDDNEDADDDNDGILDSFDNCPNSIQSGLDLDNDGCIDDAEDSDDDGDGIPDTKDNCPNGLTNWQSSKSTDIDGDGCMDSIEDDNIEMSILQLATSNSVMTAGIFSITMVLLAGLVLVQRNRPKTAKSNDYTNEFEYTLKIDSHFEESNNQKLEDLTKVGYSPEVAHAIMENENRIMKDLTENQP
jgi:hypothetical protein